jgi:tRNA threonylcarbamoyladenosine biosynthesis protein TsaB
MRLLALDTATEACTVALLTEHGLFAESVEIGRGHAQEILGMVDRILAQGGATLASLSGIAAGVGPGSFTGVRVSVAVAQGLAFGAGLPVVPVTSLEALALAAMRRGAQRVLACLDARMGEVYWGCYAAGAAALPSGLAPPAVGAPATVRLPEPAASGAGVPGQAAVSTPPYHGIGRGFAVYPELSRLPGLQVNPEDGLALPHAREIALIGAARLEGGKGIDPQLLEPLYVRDKVARTEAERGIGGAQGHMDPVMELSQSNAVIPR